ncbi:unnamed protein product [Adineta steineri]|uniref:Uncharacterized protein n=1 Tax=Adineta steineri TaxID=433720 RepID=A0A815Q228_9BILA|nr:unnamed protein product [Adineta steineri]CAF1456516.1 unnamed protein product [Adineta steineri]CAF1467420.1 unnamed protein product [Adineta steineri]
MTSDCGYCNLQSNIVRVMHSSSIIERICTVLSNPHLRFFTSCKVGHMHYTANRYSKTKGAEDSAVIFQVENQLYFVLITAIFFA